MMKQILLITIYYLFLFNGFSINNNLFNNPILQKTETEINQDSFFYDDEGYSPDKSWKLKGFELFIGGGIYFGSKKTANYYNGAPENNINLNLIFNNKYYREAVFEVVRDNYRYLSVTDTIVLEEYNYKSGYNMAMDISLGARYRLNPNWYLELSYSFRRLTSSNRFYFTFPTVLDGNKENPPYSNWEHGGSQRRPPLY